MKYRILLVEDDETMVDILKRNLEKWGYLVHVAEDFQNVMQEFQDFEPQLVLMDISLPFYNGYYWCGEIRKVSKVPVIFLSSSGDDMNLVMAINLGADDFVAKPFRMEVLTAKIQAVLRRTYTFGTVSPSVLTHKGLTLNLHIPGAVNIPNETIASGAIQQLPDKEQLILVYCRSGNRSKQASEKLVNLGYTNIVEFGGINDWSGEVVTQ